MSPKIFINLPVADLKKSMVFYEAIGFKNNPQFTDETAACMVVSEEIYVMILTHEKFSQFITKSISDSKTQASAILSLEMESIEKVDGLVLKALAAGGNESREAMVLDFMYQRSVEDPDGHNWEFFFMDMSKFPSA
jgi:predicted lactoylglutathione lyase